MSGVPAAVIARRLGASLRMAQSYLRSDDKAMAQKYINEAAGWLEKLETAL